MFPSPARTQHACAAPYLSLRHTALPRHEVCNTARWPASAVCSRTTTHTYPNSLTQPAHSGVLSYYKNLEAYQQGQPPYGSINCNDVIKLTCSASGYDFDVETPGRVYHLRVKQLEERSKWVRALQDAGVSREVFVDDMEVRRGSASSSSA